MDALSAVSLVHFYYTRTHQILCGVRGSDHRSTKHSRGVTCHACVRLLGERPDVPHEHAEVPTGHAAS
jgi:hypothetical protein